MIRPATVEDIPNCLRMGRLFVPLLEIGVDFDEASAYATISGLIESDSGVLFLSDHGMIGGVIYPHFFNRNRLMAQELFFWVDPESRGKGTSRELLDAFEAWAAQKGADSVSMIAVASQRPKAVGEYYMRRGYKHMESSYIMAIP